MQPPRPAVHDPPVTSAAQRPKECWASRHRAVRAGGRRQRAWLAAVGRGGGSGGAGGGGGGGSARSTPSQRVHVYVYRIQGSLTCRGQCGDNPGLCEHLQPQFLSSPQPPSWQRQRRCFTGAAALCQVTLTLFENSRRNRKVTARRRNRAGEQTHV